MAYLERKIHSGFVGILFLFAAILLLFFHARPTQNELYSLARSVSNLTSEVSALEGTKPADFETSSEISSEIEQKELSQAIPEHLNQDQLITDLNRIALAADVSFNALTFNLQKDIELPVVNISAAFQGPAPNIIRFLKMLEVNPRKFVVKDAGMARTEVREGIELVNLNVTLQSFYRYE
jgi:hypothetical protein